MSFSTFSRTPHSVAANIYDKPVVILAIDAYGFGDEMIDILSEDGMPATIARFARGFGAVADAKLYVPERKFLQSHENKWEKYGIKRVVSAYGEPADDMNLDLCERYAHDAQKRTYVLIGYRSNHSEVVRRLAASGNVVVLAYLQNDNVFAPYHDMVVHVDMNHTILKGAATKQSSDEEAWKPTIRDFVLLLHETEQQLPFVGAKHFITRIMPRSGLGSVSECQELFNRANELAYIELYTSKNINEGEADVTACKLKRDNEDVAAILNTQTEWDDDGEPMGEEEVNETNAQ